MATELAKAYVQIVPSAEGISSGLESIFNGSDVSASTSKAGSSIGSSLVKGIGGALVAGTAAVAGAAASLWSGINSTAAVGDNIDKTSQKLQVTTDQYQAMAFAAEHCGFSTSVLNTAQKKLADSDFSGNIYDAIGYIQTLGTEEERTAAASELFGTKAAQQMQPLINGSMTIDEYSKNLSELGGMMSSEAVSASAAFEDALTDLSTSISGAKNGIMAEFLPGCTDVITGLTMIFSGDGGGTAIISQGLTDITSNFTEMIPNIIETISSMLPTLLEAAIQIIEAIAQGLIEALPELMPSVIQLIGQLINDIIQMLPQIIEMGMEILLQLAVGIAQALPDLIPTIVDVIITITETLIDNIDLLIDASIQIIIALAEGLINALPRLIEKAPVIIDKLITAFVNNAPKLITSAAKLIVELAGGLIKSIPLLIKAIPQIITSLVNGLIEGSVAIVTVGADLVTGLWNGIGDKLSWLKDKLSGFCKNALGAIKSFFGIASPSKVFRDEVGKWIPEGMAVGINANADAVYDSMEELKANTLDIGDVRGSFNYEYSAKSSDNGLERVLELLNEYLPAIGNQQLVLDTGALVGGTVSQFDSALGKLQISKGRGR